jgi:hypothetical protein
MHVRKYDKLYTRRQCLEGWGKAAAGAGILMPLFDAWAGSGDVRAAYPDEALQIETYSRGAVKPGGMLDAGNVDSVKDLLDPITYLQIKTHGRICRVKETTTDINRLNPIPYLEATARNAGQARLDPTGNVVTADGKPWIGGNPFPNPDDAQKIVAAHALNWGRMDQASTPYRLEVVDYDGNTTYAYDFYWVEVYAAGRTVLEPQPYMPGHEDKLKFQTSLMTYPADISGTAALSIWDYDQSRFPRLQTYSPMNKRVRRMPGNQRFEPMMPGASTNASDTWAIGDPYMTWGNFKLLGKTPFIGAASGNWHHTDPNWLPERVGGRNGRLFPLTTVELIPEAFVVELEPVTYANAPLSRKRVWFDARTLMPMAMIGFDKAGQLTVGYTLLYDEFAKGDQFISHTFPKPSKIPYWGYTGGIYQNLGTNSINLMLQPREVSSGYTLRANDPDAYSRYCTIDALPQLGGA